MYITQLTSQGYTASEALQQVKDGYYENLGALQMRAQLYDMYVHVLGDPINYVFPMIKPIERIKALSYFASSSRWADDVVDAARVSTKALRAGDLAKFDEVRERPLVIDQTSCKPAILSTIFPTSAVTRPVPFGAGLSVTDTDPEVPSTWNGML